MTMRVGLTSAHLATAYVRLMMKMNRRSHGRPTHTTSWTNPSKCPARCARNPASPSSSRMVPTILGEGEGNDSEVLLLSPLSMTKHSCFRRYRCQNCHLPPAQGGRRYVARRSQAEEYTTMAVHPKKLLRPRLPSYWDSTRATKIPHLLTNSRCSSRRRCVVASRSRIPGCPENAASKPIHSLLWFRRRW